MKRFFEYFFTTLIVGILIIMTGIFLFMKEVPNDATDTTPIIEADDPVEADEPIEVDEYIEPAENVPEEITVESVILAFGGDVYFTELYQQEYDKLGISAIADEEMLQLMKDADLLMLNNEFAFSQRGEPMEDKTYTLKCDPKYVRILQDLGTDLVSIANNHVLDFGQTAFLDTLDTLKNAGIAYVGGGLNLSEALSPAVYELHGQTFAIFAATRVIPTTEWYAYENSPGILPTYNPTMLNEAIEAARPQYDHIIVYAHWGLERMEAPEDYQRELAKSYIDAGADLVLGCHPHILQGFEYYKGVPIVYSLGNYLFSNHQDTTVLLQAEFSPDDRLTLRLIPCERKDFVLQKKEMPENMFRHLESISYGVTLSEDGVLSPRH